MEANVKNMQTVVTETNELLRATCYLVDSCFGGTSGLTIRRYMVIILDTMEASQLGEPAIYLQKLPYFFPNYFDLDEVYSEKKNRERNMEK
jgi:hypothetical protein